MGEMVKIPLDTNLVWAARNFVYNHPEWGFEDENEFIRGAIISYIRSLE